MLDNQEPAQVSEAPDGVFASELRQAQEHRRRRFSQETVASPQKTTPPVVHVLPRVPSHELAPSVHQQTWTIHAAPEVQSAPVVEAAPRPTPPVAASRQKVVQYDFEARNDSELSVHTGEVLTLLMDTEPASDGRRTPRPLDEADDAGKTGLWWFVKNGRGQEGMDSSRQRNGEPMR